MPFAVLALAIVMTFFTILSYETGKQATRTEERMVKREADDVASQMMSLSQALTHWLWQNPSATALPAVSTLGLPFSTPDSRIGYALSGGRLWVWSPENSTPGLAARFTTLTLGSGLLFRFSSGVLKDMQGNTVSTSGLTLPSALQSASGTQLVHLN
ncbi:type IV pilus biogenesis protein PilM [Salmonella enterica subsp. enterica serovar Putten]|nr:type IV pilus biogenesis protein PilM [Salmonella enterica subsp. enterica serovar Putten]